MQPETECWPESAGLSRFLAGEGVMGFRLFRAPATQSLCSSPFYPFVVSGITGTPQSRALAASKNHKEAEKRRRERISSHLDQLRNLLPCNSKTDKASLLAKVIHRLKELKQQTSELTQLETFPSDTGEVSVRLSESSSGDGKLLIRASLCCEDRSDLIPEIMETHRSLRLSPVRAEMATLGGRIRNVLVVEGDKDRNDELVQLLRDGLKSLVLRSSSSGLRDRSKRPRMRL